MDISTVAILVLGIVVGLLVGGLTGWLVAGSRHETGRHRDEATTQRAQARLAEAETRVARAGEEAERARAALAQAETEAARAGTVAATAEAGLATMRADLAGARAERDAALTRVDEIVADRESLVNDFKVLSSETLAVQATAADASAERRLKDTEHLLTPMAETLRTLQERLNAAERDRAATAAELRAHVQQVQTTGERLRRETQTLVTALRKPQVRGTWGELQLQRAAEISGMVEHCHFTLQQTATASDDRTVRPDMRVELGGGRVVYVDAKVPLESFLAAQEAEDDAARTAALSQFGRNVRTHVDQLSGKAYWTADTHSPEFVVLFLPSEALAAEALSQVPDLLEYGAHRQIVIASPSTLIAILRAVAFGWRQAALAESAQEVFELGRELYRRLSNLGGHVDKLGRALSAATKQYNLTVGSLESRVLVTARRMAELQGDAVDLAPRITVEEPVRQLAAGELVADAAEVAPMIGRTARRSPLPEESELRRPEPDLWEGSEATGSPQHRRSS